MGKCVFNRKWLSDAKFSWVKEFKGDKHKAMCCACNKVIDIKRMGESALKSADVYIFTQRSKFKL